MRWRGPEIAGGLAVAGLIVLFALTLWPQSNSSTAVVVTASGDSVLGQPTASPSPTATAQAEPEESPEPTEAATPTEAGEPDRPDLSPERRAEIRVQVLNAGAADGAAALATGALVEQGFQPLDPGDAVAESAGTRVLNAPGRRPAALVVGGIVGANAGQVRRADPADPNWEAFGNDLDVLVIIGPPLP